MLDQAVARGPYICQSQSLNLYKEVPDHSQMHKMHFYAWKQGLKTGQYYFRTRPARDAIKFTVDVAELIKAAGQGANQVMECLNTDNQGKANLGKKRRAVGKKPATLSSDNMKKPVAAGAVPTKLNKENVDSNV